MGGDAAVRTNRLGRAARGVSGGVGALLAAGAAWYVVARRSVLVVAPQCEGGPDCVVQVDVQPDPVVVVALLTAAVLFALMAVTGLPFAITLGNGAGLTPVPEATAQDVAKVPQDAERTTRDEVADSPVVGQAVQDPAGRDVRASLRLWNDLPADVQEAAASHWSEVWDYGEVDDLQTGLVEVARRPGRGNHPYYLTLETPDGRKTMKVSRGGRGKSGPTATG